MSIFLAVAPVNITSHPMNVTVNVSDTATLSVDATGEGLTYQWKRDGVSLTEMPGKLEGVNTPTLRVVDAQMGDEGIYSCVITNGAGDSVTSDEAFLETIGVFLFPVNGADLPNSLLLPLYLMLALFSL